MLIRVLNMIRNRLPYLILIAIGLGLWNGYVNNVGFLKGLVTPVLFLMVYPMMINVRIDQLFSDRSSTKPLLFSLGANFIVSPIIAFVLAKVFLEAQPMLALGLFIIALIPTSGMTASWTGLARGNLQAALVIMSANLLLAIVLLPILLQIMVGTTVAVNTQAVLRSLLVVVVAPLLLGDVTRRLIIKTRGVDAYRKMKPHFSGVSSVGVLMIVFIAVSLRSRAIFEQLDIVALSLVSLLLYYLSMLGVSLWMGRKWLSPENTTALVYGATMRNLTIALGLTLGAMQDADSSGLAVFLIAVAYLVQVPLAAFSMRFLTVDERS